MKKGKPFLNMDERNKQVAYRVMAIMYLLTILALQGIVDGGDSAQTPHYLCR